MKTLLALISGAIIAASFPTDAKTYDEKKWEQLAQHREMRRGIERKYETCVRSCQEECK